MKSTSLLSYMHKRYPYPLFIRHVMTRGEESNNVWTLPKMSPPLKSSRPKDNVTHLLFIFFGKTRSHLISHDTKIFFYHTKKWNKKNVGGKFVDNVKHYLLWYPILNQIWTYHKIRYLFILGCEIEKEESSFAWRKVHAKNLLAWWRMASKLWRMGEGESNPIWTLGFLIWIQTKSHLVCPK